ncbi:MAG: nucleoside deaminase [Bacteroidetes bacterium]|nr:nucleoside deaminase [Bacteroidota bacterium]MBS1633538.1 nucleoside deaminase [Bacteroidota bacterium]
MTDEYFMMQAIKEAKKALEDGEVPIGAVVVMNEKVIARGHNMVEKLNDPTAHAEMIALTSAFNMLGAKYIPESILYITVEPCLMCAGAIFWSQVKKVVYGADDEKNGYKKTAGANWPFHPKTELIRGVLKDDCSALVKNFFRNKR